MLNSKYDLLVIGNAIVDEVYCINEFPQENTSNTFTSYKTSIGGIGNLIEALSNSKLKIMVECVVGKDEAGKKIADYLSNKDHILHQSDLPTSKALILSNINKSERTSFVNWGCANETFISNTKAKWTHISYLDIMPKLDLQELKKNSEIVSADLCLSSPYNNIKWQILLQLEYIDYLIISETEFISYSKEINERLLKKQLNNVIIHSKTHTLIMTSDGVQIVETAINNHNNVNVLGAGDVYCANFIKHKLNNNSDEKAALYAHEQATNFVLQVNKF